MDSRLDGSSQARHDDSPVTQFDRMEIKYRLTADQASVMAAALAAELPPDEHGNPPGHYQVESLYFDNVDLEIYWELVRKADFRRKLRIRVYVADEGSPLSFVEIKQRAGERTAKRRAALPVPVALALCSGRSALGSISGESEAVVVHEAAHLAVERQLYPVCLVRYDRQAFVSDPREPGLRVTLDRNVVYRTRHLTDLGNGRAFDHRLLEPGEAILEIKVPQAVPAWLQAQIDGLGLKPKGASKYGQIMARGLNGPAD